MLCLSVAATARRHSSGDGGDGSDVGGVSRSGRRNTTVRHFGVEAVRARPPLGTMTSVVARALPPFSTAHVEWALPPPGIISSTGFGKSSA